ncbi:MAG: TPM domain-containing protein [Bacteroidota bacterium]
MFSRLLLLIFLLLPDWSLARTDTPLQLPTGQTIVDAADILTEEEAMVLGRSLRNFQDESGHQCVILTIEELGDKNLAELSIQTARNWKLGTGEQGNAILIVVVKNSRQIRFEIGRALAKSITNEAAAAIIRDMQPHFRSEDYFSGFQQALKQLSAEIEQGGEEKKRYWPQTILVLLGLPIIIGWRLWLNKKKANS